MNSRTAVRVFTALAQETRLAVFRHLVQAGPEGLPAGQVARDLGIQPATLSFHLKELVQAGLLQSQRFSRSIVYSPNFAAMQSVLQFLTENCCQGGSCSTPDNSKESTP